jgi:hypothetical protein
VGVAHGSMVEADGAEGEDSEDGGVKASTPLPLRTSPASVLLHTVDLRLTPNRVSGFAGRSSRSPWGWRESGRVERLSTIGPLLRPDRPEQVARPPRHSDPDHQPRRHKEARRDHRARRAFPMAGRRAGERRSGGMVFTTEAQRARRLME